MASTQASSFSKWTDENGRVYYGDTPPHSVNSKLIKTNKRPSDIGKPLPRLSTDSSKSKQPQTSASPQSLDNEQAKEACESAKKDLAVIKKGSRIQLRSADGSLRYMSKDEIQQRLDRSNDEIDNFCR